ncbi:hypothetical protein GGTG_06276 [Gaeumannomyces tritici R3-111a-1]|uniref:Uncharacterized protein n=1 Tax=Gaeumannomyces tritici (strain R3-111a-1) TaxID=644352 RepID=J3NYC3_GAET3|nr:hypothetical protein GGTG_06276 [Gaeumannomyces tritici R3-111a-1]EJT76356.1 hypothetical protein GGTG_06276 [Gaeumannomyces tritici R3-111a-1]
MANCAVCEAIARVVATLLKQGLEKIIVLDPNRRQTTWNYTRHLPLFEAINFKPKLGRDCTIEKAKIRRQDLEMELRKSDYIISGAAFTIADVDGRDAEYGLRGVRELPDPEPRSFKQKVCQVHHNIVSSPQQSATTTIAVPSEGYIGSIDATYCAVRADNSSNTDKCKSRAWTRGVEAMLARRLLFFEGGTVRWTCAPAECKATPCPGDASQNCGGERHMVIYSPRDAVAY